MTKKLDSFKDESFQNEDVPVKECFSDLGFEIFCKLCIFHMTMALKEERSEQPAPKSTYLSVPEVSNWVMKGLKDIFKIDPS